MKIFNASCSGGIVSANGGSVPNCPILGEGGNSSGYLVMAEDKLVYLPKTTPDVKSLIVQLENLCDKISALTVTCAGAGSPSSTPINAADFTAIKSNLTTLKGALK